MSRKVVLRLAVVFAFVGAIAIYIYYQTSHAWQYEVVARGILYRCAARSIEEFRSSEIVTRPASVMLIRTQKQSATPPYTDIVQYCFRNSIRVLSVDVPPDARLTYGNVAQALQEVGKVKRQPVLMVCPDGAYSGQVAAAYRLAVMKLPLAEVEKLAQLSDAPPATTQTIRDFARDYDQALRRMAPGSATQEALPQGPPAPAAVSH